MSDTALSLVKSDAPKQRIERVRLLERKPALAALAEFADQAPVVTGGWCCSTARQA